MAVYFIKEDIPEGCIKIGFAKDGTENTRLSGLRVGNRRPLVLVAHIPKAGRSEESRIQDMFASDRVRGEWYRPSEDLLSFIEQNAVAYTYTPPRREETRRLATAARPDRLNLSLGPAADEYRPALQQLALEIGRAHV